MQKWMYVTIGVVVVGLVILGVRSLAPGRLTVDNGVPAPNGNAANGVRDDDDSDGRSGAPATSLEFSVDWTNDETTRWKFAAKDIGEADFKLRVDWSVEGGVHPFEEGVIIDAGLRELWHLQDGQWIAQPAELWESYWGTFVTALFDVYSAELYARGYQGWTYEDVSGHSVRVHGIQVNPHLPDSLFKP